MTAWTGYELPAAPESYADLRDGFAWAIPERYNIAEVALQSDPERTALCHLPEDAIRVRDGEPKIAADGVRTLTYGDLDAASAAVATALGEAGVQSGDCVAVCLPQCPELVVAHLAVLRLGGIVVPVSMLLGDDALSYVLDHSDAETLFVDDRRREQITEGALTGPESVIAVRVDDGGGALGGLEPFSDGGPVSEEGPMEPRAPEDPAMVLYTSGTTSDPKGVVQAHQYLLGSLPGYHCWFELFDAERAEQSRVWTPSEWAWAGALFDVVFPTLAVGGTVGSAVRRAGFDPARALSVVETLAVSHAFLPPTALRAVERETAPSPIDVPTLETVVCGGEALPDSLASWAESTLGITVNEAYGQTEANALAGECAAVYSDTDDALGRPYPGHDLSILDDDGRRVDDGETGEIAVSLPDPVVMQGYLYDEAATDAALDGDVLRTGDVGRMHPDGALQHLGRRDDLVLSSGYRISPLEVESTLVEHPAVSAALVGGEPDPERGQIVVATVVPAAGSTDEDALADTLREYVADRLGPYKRPRRVEFVSELSTTRTDKTDRSESE